MLAFFLAFFHAVRGHLDCPICFEAYNGLTKMEVAGDAKWKLPGMGSDDKPLTSMYVLPVFESAWDAKWKLPGMGSEDKQAL